MKKVIANKEPGDTVELKYISEDKIYLYQDSDEWYQVNRISNAWISLPLNPTFISTIDEACSLELLLSNLLQEEYTIYEFDSYTEMVTFLYKQL
ncbi:MAG: hypothetical protein GY834_10680 [Bacteroidetes bacterium]|nr:hypothetical protein [Bacteroidota bacterium]